MKLALFDLDFTLLPLDSGMAFLGHLVATGALPAEAQAHYLQTCIGYVDGREDIAAVHRACIGPLATHAPERLAQWQAGFAQAIAAEIPPAAHECVQRHLAAGDLCAIVTATSRIVAEPVARAFGIVHLVATEPARRDGRPTGEIDGEPCHREHKPAHVERWLASLGQPRLADFSHSVFYSDAYGDLPLLQAVTEPVAVDPDERLARHALESGWTTAKFSIAPRKPTNSA